MLTSSFRFPCFPLPVRFLSSASVPLPATQLAVSSFPLFPLPPHSGFPGAPLRFRFLAFPVPSDLVSHADLPGSRTRLCCSFPFVLPCFAPAAVPQVIPFQITPPGPVPDFRFLSSTSVLASHYSGFCSSFSTYLPGFASQLAISVLLFRSRFPGFSPYSRPGFPCLLSGSVYLAFCLFPFALPCFTPTAVPQVLAWFRSPFGSLPFSIVPFFSTFFRPFLFRFRLLGFPFLLFPSSLSCLTVAFQVLLSVFPSACFHASVPTSVLGFSCASFLRFAVSPHRCYFSCRPPVSSSAVPLCFRFRFWLLGLSI